MTGTAAGPEAGSRDWSPWQESNLHLALRRHLFYPLNYREYEGEHCAWLRQIAMFPK
jgi:hypothetical protein